MRGTARHRALFCSKVKPVSGSHADNLMRSAKPPRSSKGRLGCILVVEDDAVLALSMELALLDAGAKSVVVCPSIAGAMEVLGEQRPDGIILDIHLADRDDGWTLAELVGQLGPPHPRIIFSTGSPDEIPPAIADMGPVFEKPYDLAQLVEALSGEERRGLFARIRAAMG